MPKAAAAAGWPAGSVLDSALPAAPAVIAQSEGTAGRRNIDVTYEGGTMTGNSDSAVRFLDGTQNTFTNYGVITTHGGTDGTAILTSSGHDTIHNYGTIHGSVNLGSGVNELYNYVGATLLSGQTLQLGMGATVVNEGVFSPGGSNVVCTTVLDGNLQQSASAELRMDWDMRLGQSDRIEVSGTADLAGQTQVNILNVGYVAPGATTTTLITGDGGVVDSGLALAVTRTAVMDYDMAFVNGNQVQLTATMDAAPAGLSSEKPNRW